MAYYLRSKSAVNSAEHIYATIAPPKKAEPIYETPINHKLAIVNITGKDRYEDYELAMKYRVIGSNKPYAKTYKPNDIIVIYMIESQTSNKTIMGVIESPDNRVDDYLNEGGRICETYLCFCPILMMESSKTTTISFFGDSNIQIEVNLTRQQLFDKVTNSINVTIPNTQAMYNSWFIENRPENMTNVYKYTVFFMEACFELFYRWMLNQQIGSNLEFNYLKYIKNMNSLHMMFKKSQHPMRVHINNNQLAKDIDSKSYTVKFYV